MCLVIDHFRPFECACGSRVPTAEAEFGRGDVCDADIAGGLGIEVHCSPDGTGEARVARERSSQQGDANGSARRGSFGLAAGECPGPRPFLDLSLTEVNADSPVCLTDRIYLSRADSVGVGLIENGAG